MKIPTTKPIRPFPVERAKDTTKFLLNIMAVPVMVQIARPHRVERFTRSFIPS